MHAELMDVDIEGALREIQARRARFRSKGRHLSDVVHYYMTKMQPRRFKEDARASGVDPLVFHKGFLWEDVISMAFAKQFGNVQLELLLDGIFMTLDGLRLVERAVKEYKASKMSAVDNIRSRRYEHWHIRTMGYCAAASTEFDVDIHTAHLVVLYLNGSYELAGGRFGMEVVRPWKLTYTRRELIENWDLIRRVRDEMDKDEEAA